MSQNGQIDLKKIVSDHFEVLMDKRDKIVEYKNIGFQEISVFMD